MSKIFNVIIALFLLGAGFVLGLTLSYKDDVNVIERTKRTVLGYLNSPKLESFKDVGYHFDKISHNGGEVGYVCGYVSRHYDFVSEVEFKRFVVKTYIKPDGEINISIPAIDGVEEVFDKPQIDKLWNSYCISPTLSN
ncbi:hypothetical protein ABN072_06265 [Providencia rettgeri]|uniref:hypothetical protein n=1 Tax=Providencia TaxID=586 RepID=UPI000F47E7C2|nr:MULTISPECIES: hypothetical protein [Providencia]MBS0859700.1 hypothetical protein [Providencia rettgeri]MBS0872957.1 hypothetical protein [Providencia rettgeri]MBS0920749.1 hypothetical protein [Providencia rettgeri]QIF57537.1 hypothetical protein FVA69_08715 [Providencia sp. 1701011]QIF61586.1 hypothetical protein FVA70_08730 [Providencia sp. 1701091]